MKRATHILLYLMIYIVCSSRGCEDGIEHTVYKEQARTETLKDSVRTIFSSDYLDGRALDAFMLTAEHKLKDFADYLGIVSDTSLDMKFRQQASALISRLFISDNINVSAWNAVYSPPLPEGLTKLLEQGLTDGLPYRLSPSDIYIEAPFIQKNDTAYAGSLGFTVEKLLLNESNISGKAELKMQIDVYLIKRLKEFDGVQLRIWDVFLGDII